MLKRILVIAEVTLVFFAGTFAAIFVRRQAGIAGSKQAIHGASVLDVDAALAVAIPMALRWTMVIGLAFLAGWLFARHRSGDYGLTLAKRPVRFHLFVGLVTYVFLQTPVQLLVLLRRYLELPGGPPIWNAIENASWNAGFWMFMLASSIVLPVVVEEIFFRGYAQTRLITVFRPLTAILMISVVFILAHTQYLDGTFVGTSRIVTGIWWAALLGVARYRTGSLAAPMLAHALSNTPMRAAFELPMFILLVLAAIALWPRFKPLLFSPWRQDGPNGGLT
jgi:membrane protease YdiL (CAAX protease family)